MKPRSPNGLTAETAERLLNESDCLTTAAVANQAGAGYSQALTLMRELEAAKCIRRTGQRRGTRHAICDEDNIQQRAAELATRPKRRKVA